MEVWREMGLTTSGQREVKGSGRQRGLMAMPAIQGMHDRSRAQLKGKGLELKVLS